MPLLESWYKKILKYTILQLKDHEDIFYILLFSPQTRGESS